MTPNAVVGIKIGVLTVAVIATIAYAVLVTNSLWRNEPESLSTPLTTASVSGPDSCVYIVFMLGETPNPEHPAAIVHSGQCPNHKR